MSFRKRDQYSKKLKAMRKAKEMKRVASDDFTPRFEPPELRRKVVVTDYDFGEVTHEILCFKSNRIDCYRVVIDGVEWQQRIGWTHIVNILRKGFVRVSQM